ncbi:hypothetical protein LCGC14_2452330, partial [marine sediment metagenome]
SKCFHRSMTLCRGPYCVKCVHFIEVFEPNQNPESAKIAEIKKAVRSLMYIWQTTGKGDYTDGVIFALNFCKERLEKI